MGKRSREKREVRSETNTGGPASTPPSRATTAASPRPAIDGRRLLCFRLLVMFGGPLAVLLFLEVLLRLAGYGFSPAYFEPAADGTNLTTNPRFAWQFYSRETSTAPTPLLFPKVRPPGTKRVLVLGESAAAGTPDPAFSFSRMLEIMLRRQHPGARVEVINVAMRGINSHILLPIARECAALEPDLTILYAGNNELIGLHSPSPGEFNITPHLRLLRIGHTVKRTRTYQLLQAGLRGVLPAPANKRQDMEYLRTQRLAFDDPARTAVYENFSANLGDICDALQGSGAPLLLCSVAVNLRDFPPLGSLHRAGLSPEQLAAWEQSVKQGMEAAAAGRPADALKAFNTALAIDDHHAELHFRIARAQEASGDRAKAATHYRLARDWDALQFRTDSRLNTVTAQLATNLASRGVRFVDAETAFAGAATNGIPGGEHFHEHVHFTFAGDYQLARTLLPEVTTALQLGPAAGTIPTREDCARALAYTEIDDLNVNTAMAEQTSKPPFLDQIDHARRQVDAERRNKDRLTRTTAADIERAIGIYREAIAAAPDDWMLRYNFGNLLAQAGQHGPAAAEHERVVARLPGQRTFRLNYGHALLQSGRRVEALAQFRAILKEHPDFRPARDAIAVAERQR